MTRIAFSVVVVLLLLFIGLSGSVSAGRDLVGDILRLPSEASRFFERGRGADVADDIDDDSFGTKWAVLIANSNGYWNYRHQVILFLFIYFYLPVNFFFSIFLNLLFHKYLIFNFDFLISFFFTLGLILFFFFLICFFVFIYLFIYIYIYILFERCVKELNDHNGFD